MSPNIPAAAASAAAAICEDRCQAGGVGLGRPAAAAADHPLALSVTGHLPPSHLTPFGGNHRRADICSLVKVRI